MNKCDICIYEEDGACQKAECSFEPMTPCYTDGIAYLEGYQQGKEDAIKEMKGFIVDHGLYVTFKASEWAEKIKEQKND